MLCAIFRTDVCSQKLSSIKSTVALYIEVNAAIKITTCITVKIKIITRDHLSFFIYLIILAVLMHMAYILPKVCYVLLIISL